MSEDDLLSAAEAAERLGVKRQTLYAYVSRGILERTVATDGRRSLFDPDEVDAVRGQRRRSPGAKVPSVISSAITRLDETGLTYRGRAVPDLVDLDTDFESVADLLWQHAGPWGLTHEDVIQIRSAQNALADTTPAIDRLRVTIAVLSATDHLRNDLSPESVAASGRRMLAGMVAGLPKLHLGPRDRLADQLWLSLVDDPGPDDQRRALNSALVLLADHGLATSTLAVRVAASGRADPYSVISTGLGAVGGVAEGAADGAASGGVQRLLDRAEQLGPERALGEELAVGRRLPGVGHDLYRHHDPREASLLNEIRSGWAGDDRLEVALELRSLVIERLPGPVAIDFALGILMWLTDMDSTGAEIFAVARTAGWLAHLLEELGEVPARFRPVVRYVGPT